MTGTWDERQMCCSKHGTTNTLTARGIGAYTFCPKCKIDRLEHELEVAREDIGLLQGQLELHEEVIDG